MQQTLMAFNSYHPGYEIPTEHALRQVSNANSTYLGRNLDVILLRKEDDRWPAGPMADVSWVCDGPLYGLTVCRRSFPWYVLRATVPRWRFCLFRGIANGFPGAVLLKEKKYMVKKLAFKATQKCYRKEVVSSFNGKQ